MTISDTGEKTKYHSYKVNKTASKTQEQKTRTEIIEINIKLK